MALLQPAPLSRSQYPQLMERGCHTTAPSQTAQHSHVMFAQSPSRTRGLNNLVKASIVNADSALYDKVCRYHTSSAGNICVFGTSCHYLHFAHLERPRARTPSEETQVTFDAIKSDVIELQKRLSTVENMLQSQTTKTQHVDELKINSVDILDAGPVQQNLTGNDELPAATVDAPCESTKTTPPTTAKVSIDNEPVETSADIEEVKLGTTPTDEQNERKETDTDNDREDNLDFEQQIETKYEDIIDAKVNLEDPRKDDFDWANPSDAKQCEKPLQQSQIDLFKFLWANSKDDLLQVLPPQTLPDTYPKRLLCTFTDTQLPLENATLRGLNTAKYNDLPVIITGYESKKKRYAVQIADLRDRLDIKIKYPPPTFTVKRAKLKLLEATDISGAFDDFKQFLQQDPMAKRNKGLLQSIDEDQDPNTNIDTSLLVTFFIRSQLAPIPKRDSQLRDCLAWDDDVAFPVKEACMKAKLYVTREHCPIIISMLYHVSFLRKFKFVWKRYRIPTTWTWKACPDLVQGLTHMLWPPNDI